MKLYTYIICLFLFLSTQAQVIDPDFGDISLDELQMQPEDDTNALILHDIGESKFVDTNDGWYKIHFTRKKRIKIFNEKGLDQSEIVIYTQIGDNGQKEKVKNIKAVTYNLENGTITQSKVEKSSIFEETINKRWKLKKFVFPNVKPGSVLELEYLFETPFMFHLPDWEFQSEIPTKYSSYKVHMIPFYEYIYLVQGVKSFFYTNSEESKKTRTWGNVTSYGGIADSKAEFKDVIYTYVLKDIPAFTSEKYITSKKDYLIKMNFQLAKFHDLSGRTTQVMSTWPKLNNDYRIHDRFGGYQKNCKKFAKTILKNELVFTDESPLKKTELIINYVKNNFTWNGTNTDWTLKDAKTFFKDKKGNSAEINLFLIALLKEAEIPVEPVLLSTRSHGKIAMDYPFEHFFNYVIAYIQLPRSFLADATNKHLPYNRVPAKCINDNGLVVSKGEARWINLNNSVTSWEKRQIKIELNTDDLKADFTSTLLATENAAFKLRNRYKNDTTAIKESLINELIPNIKAIKTLNFDNPNKKYSINLIGTANLEQFGDNIVLSPFLNFSLTENLLKEKTRDYPVDLIYPRGEQFNITIKIPEGFQASQLPKNLTINDPTALIKVNYSVTNNLILIRAKYHLKKAIYTPEEYISIKSIFDTIVQKFNEQIVFQKS